MSANEHVCMCVFLCALIVIMLMKEWVGWVEFAYIGFFTYGVLNTTSHIYVYAHDGTLC